jgi:hypothetical protein
VAFSSFLKTAGAWRALTEASTGEIIKSICSVYRRRALEIAGSSSSMRMAEARAATSLVGDWPRPRLLKMDRRFCERVERAFASGRESEEAAGARMAARTRTMAPFWCSRRRGRFVVELAA